MRSFEELAAPGFRVALGASGHQWLDSECPLMRNDVCRIPPWLDAPALPVPEPATALMLIAGIVVTHLYRTRNVNR